jgi:hypothetical protein
MTIGKPVTRSPRGGLIAAGVVLGLVLLAGAAWGAFVLFTGLMRSNDVYKIAMSRVHEHAPAAERLGEPVQPGLFVQGNISVDQERGDADLRIPVAGERASGNVRAVAFRRRGDAGWIFDTLQLEIEGETPMELRTELQRDAAAASR